MGLVGHLTSYLTVCSHNLVSHNLQNSTIKRMCLEVQNAAVYFAKSFMACYIQEPIPEVVSSRCIHCLAKMWRTFRVASKISKCWFGSE